MFTQRILPRWLKQIVGFAGLFLALPGILITFGYLCTTFIVVVDYEPETLTATFIACGLAIVTLGTGGSLFWHSLASLKGKPSRMFQLPSMRVLIVGLVLYWILGSVIFESNILAGLFFSPTLSVAGTIPILFAVVAFIEQKSHSLTWRRCLIVFMSSATLSLIFILLLQTILLIIFSLLHTNPANGINSYFTHLGNLLNYGFSQRYQIENSIFILTQLTIILPIAVTLAKSLTVLPFIRQLNQYETFLIGAISGAGYAAIESMFFIALDIDSWMWILVALAIGAAVHPLGGGLIAIGWRNVIVSKSSNWSNWLAFAGIVSALHVLWSLGFFTLFIFNPLYLSGIDILAFAFLIGLGVSSLLIGRTIARHLYLGSDTGENISDSHWFEIENWSLAIWALSSLLAIVSVGIFAMRFMF